MGPLWDGWARFGVDGPTSGRMGPLRDGQALLGTDRPASGGPLNPSAAWVRRGFRVQYLKGRI